MRLCLVVVLLLALAGCGASEQPPAASGSAPASISAAASASLEAAQPSASAAAPTLVPAASTAAATSSEASPQPSAPAASAEPSTAPAPPLARTLQRVDPPLSGDDVRQLQQRLTDLGYTQVGAVDGIFGTNTEAAVRSFQLLNNIEVDGIAGQNTWALLFGDGLGVSALVPVVALTDRWLLGGSVGGRWLDGATTAPLLPGNQTYRLPGSSTTLSGGPPEILGAPCEQTWFVPLSPEAPAESDIAVGGTWELQPRPVSEADPAEDTYRQVVGEYLDEHGVSQPDIRVDRVLRADLNGDGSEETLVNASRFKPNSDTPSLSPNAAAGDYSFVILLGEGEPEVVPLESNVFLEDQEFVAPFTFTLVGVYDLNGDGNMEAVIDGAYYEGGYTAVYDPFNRQPPAEPEGDQPRPVLSAGCGA